MYSVSNCVYRNNIKTIYDCLWNRRGVFQNLFSYVKCLIIITNAPGLWRNTEHLGRRAMLKGNYELGDRVPEYN